MEAILLLGDRELATLRYRSTDGYWTYGDFAPRSAFLDFAALFERLELAWESDSTSDAQGGDDDPLEIQEMVNALGLMVRLSSGATYKVRDFKVIKGEYEYKVDN